MSKRKPWFDGQGWPLRRIPKACVEECAHPGPCDADVAYWVKKLHFEVPEDMARKHLQDYGAWLDEELAAMGQARLAGIVLWLATGDIKENGEWFGLVE